MTIGVAVSVGVKHIVQQCIGIRIDADQAALTGDREEHALVASVLKVDRRTGQTFEGFTKVESTREIGDWRSKATAAKATAETDTEELTALANAEQLSGFVTELQAGHVADNTRRATTELAAATVGIVVAGVRGAVAASPVEVGIAVCVANRVDDRQVIVGIVGGNSRSPDRQCIHGVARDLPECGIIWIITDAVTGGGDDRRISRTDLSQNTVVAAVTTGAVVLEQPAIGSHVNVTDI